MTTYGFLGAGNMAGAIVRGALASAHLRPSDILLYSPGSSALRLAEETGGERVGSADELVRRSDVLVLGVKPQVLPSVLRELEPAFAEMAKVRRTVIISLAAGITTARLEEMLPNGLAHDVAIVRAMPNMAASVRASMTALCAGKATNESELTLAENLMASVGQTIRLAEKDFSAFIGLAGSSPAFVFEFIDALARAGVAGGIPKPLAVKIVTQAVLGSAQTIAHEQDKASCGQEVRTPADLIDAVCSPAGTTIAGMLALQEHGFEHAIAEAFAATVARDRELGA